MGKCEYEECVEKLECMCGGIRIHAMRREIRVYLWRNENTWENANTRNV